MVAYSNEHHLLILVSTRDYIPNLFYDLVPSSDLAEKERFYSAIRDEHFIKL